MARKRIADTQLEITFPETGKAEELKWCSFHARLEPIAEFGKNKARPDGLAHHCRAAGRELDLRRRSKKPGYKPRPAKPEVVSVHYEGPIVTRKEALAQGLTKYFDAKPCPKGHIAERRVCNWNCTVCEYETIKARREADPEASNDYHREWRKRNPDKVKKASSNYYYSHHEQRLAEMDEYRNNNRSYFTDRITRLYNEDINFKLRHNLRARGRKALKVKNQGTRGGSFFRDLGCTVDFLRQYIEERFHDGMTWDNWGTVWELDHVRPLATFDLTIREQFLEAVHYTNLQPLTWQENRSKKRRNWKKDDTATQRSKPK